MCAIDRSTFSVSSFCSCCPSALSTRSRCPSTARCTSGVPLKSRSARFGSGMCASCPAAASPTSTASLLYPPCPPPRRLPPVRHSYHPPLRSPPRPLRRGPLHRRGSPTIRLRLRHLPQPLLRLPRQSRPQSLSRTDLASPSALHAVTVPVAMIEGSILRPKIPQDLASVFEAAPLRGIVRENFVMQVKDRPAGREPQRLARKAMSS